MHIRPVLACSAIILLASVSASNNVLTLMDAAINNLTKSSQHLSPLSMSSKNIQFTWKKYI